MTLRVGERGATETQVELVQQRLRRRRDLAHLQQHGEHPLDLGGLIHLDVGGELEDGFVLPGTGGADGPALKNSRISPIPITALVSAGTGV